MYEALVARVRYHIQKANFMGLKEAESTLLLGEAADAIEELAASVEGFEAQTNMVLDRDGYNTVIRFEPRWIPVTERLPENTGKYLVCGQWNGKPTETWVCELIAFGKIKGWANEARNPAVAYWMPLPEPPKEE